MTLLKIAIYPYIILGSAQSVEAIERGGINEMDASTGSYDRHTFFFHHRKSQTDSAPKCNIKYNLLSHEQCC